MNQILLGLALFVTAASAAAQTAVPMPPPAPPEKVCAVHDLSCNADKPREAPRDPDSPPPSRPPPGPTQRHGIAL